MQIHVFGAPSMLQGTQWQQGTAVVIDALRMTTVAATALQHGCVGMLAVAEVEEARAQAKRYDALLGGERGALRISGFDFSNSPLEYTPVHVAGKRIVMTTSNGTSAIMASMQVQRLLLGCFCNATAVADKLHNAEQVSLICAGTLGIFTLEDALAAGAMIARLQKTDDCMLDDMALASWRMYLQARADLHGALRATAHYQRLEHLGFQADLQYCLQEDCVQAVPMVAEDGWITCTR